MKLLSWIGVTDFETYANQRRNGDGPLLAVALRIQPTQLEILWDDYGRKAPLGEAEAYRAWLTQQLSDAGLTTEITVHPCRQAQIVDFEWVFSQVKRVAEAVNLQKGPTSINASSGTWVMQACWIVYKKTTGLDLQLYQSSIQQGVIPVHLPPNLTIDMTEVAQGRLLPLVEAHLRGDLSVNLSEYRDWIFESPRMKEIVLQAHLIARFTDVPVLLLGPPGSGKSRLAKMIHERSGLKADAWVAIDCGTLQDDVSRKELWGWEQGAFTGAMKRQPALIAGADHGTVFFDEIGNAPAVTQQGLLRLIQEKKYRPAGATQEIHLTTRVVAATNSDLRTQVLDGSFRQDLYDRLSGFVIEIPALKDHPEDIVPLAQLRLQKFYHTWAHELEAEQSLPKTLTAEAQRELQRYVWPGNIRELENVVHRVAIMTIHKKNDRYIHAEDVRRELLVAPVKPYEAILGRPIGNGFKLQDVFNEVANHYVGRAREQAGKNRSTMAELLGFSRTNRTPLKTIQTRLKKAGYDVSDF